MPTGRRAPADPTQGEVAVGRCATCGATILAGDGAWQGPEGAIYCDSYCAARAYAYQVTVEADRMVYTTHYTLDEALRIVRDHWALHRRIRDMREIYQGIARRFRQAGRVHDALWYEAVVRDINRMVLQEESPAGGQGAAGDQYGNGAWANQPTAPPF